jgi:ATP synthase protein I
MAAPEQKDLRELGDRLDALQKQHADKAKAPPPTSMGIAFRFSTEMVAALVVGGGIGYGIDWFAGTKPIFLIIFFVLGATAGIRNVLQAAKELNAEMASKSGDGTS